MGTTTTNLGLKKPTPKTERDWDERLNENADILDDSLLVANLTVEGTSTGSDDGAGNVTISGHGYVGDDGILYMWDSTRSKNLSVSRQTLQYGRNVSNTSGASVLSAAGTITAGFGQSANVMYRDATITTIAAQAPLVSGSVYFRTRVLSDGGGATNLFDIILDGSVYPDAAAGPVSTVSGELNIDIPAGSGIEVYLPGTAGTEMTDPLCNIEIAWRDS